MFTVSVERRFWASHQLTLPDGSKEPLHGHNWSVTAQLSSEELDSMGFVMDFQQLKAILDDITAGLGNAELEKNDYFRRNNSSAESVAKYIYERLITKLPRGVKLESVSVVEEVGCTARFVEGG